MAIPRLHINETALLVVDIQERLIATIHMLRVRLNRDSVVLEVDAHSLDPNLPTTRHCNIAEISSPLTCVLFRTISASA